MPYKSDAQRRWAHTDKGEKALGGPEGVHEWDEASKGKKLPEHVKKMAEGGITSGNPSDLDPGIKDATLSDFLAPYLMGGAPAKEIAESAGEKLASETGSLFPKTYAEEKFATSLPVKAYTEPGIPYYDEVKGLNPGHALWRAKDNWPGTEVVKTGLSGPVADKAQIIMDTIAKLRQGVNQDMQGLSHMAGGGIAESSDTTNSPAEGNDPYYTEVGQGITSGVNHDMDAVKDYLMKIFEQPMDSHPATLGTDTTGLQGIANKEAEAPNMASGGGIGFGHREKSGPALTKSINMADGGMTPDDFSVGNDDTTVSTPDVTKYSPVDPTALPPAAQDMPIPTAPKFNPQSGLPPVTPAPTQPMPPPGGAVNPALTQYLAQQKQAIGQYGPEQQLQVSNDILKRQNSPGSLVGQGLAGLGDAIMQGVARTGNPGFLKGVQERQQQQGTQQINALERARGANLQNVEAGQKLDAMDPSSAFSKAEQATYAPLFAKLGYKPEQLGTMSAANIQNALQLMTQFGGKQIEMMIKQFELKQKQQEINETIRSHKATEGTEEQKVGTEAAKEILNGSKIPGVPPSHEAKLGAENVLEQAAGVTKAAPYGNTTVRNGKSYTWDPESSKYYLSGNE